MWPKDCMQPLSRNDLYKSTVSESLDKTLRTLRMEGVCALQALAEVAGSGRGVATLASEKESFFVPISIPISTPMSKEKL